MHTTAWRSKQNRFYVYITTISAEETLVNERKR